MPKRYAAPNPIPLHEEPEWLRAVIENVSQEKAAEKQTTSNLLKSRGLTMRSEALLPLFHSLKHGDKEEQHDAAKAIGYVAKTGSMTTDQRFKTKAFLITHLQEEKDLSLGVAFAILEALERVDSDAFWTLVMGWYGMYQRKQNDSIENNDG